MHGLLLVSHKLDQHQKLFSWPKSISRMATTWFTPGSWKSQTHGEDHPEASLAPGQAPGQRSSPWRGHLRGHLRRPLDWCRGQPAAWVPGPCPGSPLR